MAILPSLTMLDVKLKPTINLYVWKCPDCSLSQIAVWSYPHSDEVPIVTCSTQGDVAGCGKRFRAFRDDPHKDCIALDANDGAEVCALCGWMLSEEERAKARKSSG